jgi:hypothetical protein
MTGSTSHKEEYQWKHSIMEKLLLDLTRDNLPRIEFGRTK